eukprot:gene4165-19172_t
MILDCVAKWRYGKVTCAACNASCPAPPPSPPTSTSPPPPPPPGCTVFLTFGSVDIEWNLGYKRDFKKQTVDSAAYVAGMAHSLATTAQRIINLNSTENRTTLATAAATSSPADASSSAPAPGNTGAAQQHAASFSDTNDSRHGIDVVVVFPTMPLPLSSDYLEDHYNVPSLAERLQLWSDFRNAVKEAVVGMVPASAVGVERDGGDEDHHPDYIKTQHCIAAKLAKLPTLNVVAPTPQLTTLYIADSTRHVPRFKGPTGKYACNK